MNDSEIKKLAKGVISAGLGIPNSKREKKFPDGYIPKNVPISKRIKEFLFAQDFKTSYESVVETIIKPSIQMLIVEAAMGTLERMFLGDRAGKRSFTPTTYTNGPIKIYGDTTSYGAYYKGNVMPAPQQPTVRVGRAYEYTKWRTPEEAKAVIDYIEEKIRVNQYCSVSQLYDKFKIPEFDWTDNNFGWLRVDGYSILPEAGTDPITDPDGHVLRLPNPVPIPSELIQK